MRETKSATASLDPFRRKMPDSSPIRMARRSPLDISVSSPPNRASRELSSRWIWRGRWEVDLGL